MTIVIIRKFLETTSQTTVLMHRTIRLGGLQSESPRQTL